MKKLTKPQKAKLRTASRDFPEKYFVELSTSVRNKRWLASSNRYREKCISRFDRDARTAGAVRQDQIAKYVSASAPAHAIDGWAFLGRAVDATLRGDRASAVFFGYYAELRAAMALMAAEGLGIFNGKHPVVSSVGVTDVLSGPRTHDIAWLALNHWAGLKRANVLINALIAPRGTPLSVWLANLAPGKSLSALTDQWLSLWGIDLVALTEDHDLRNLSSYRPSQFRSEDAISATGSLSLVSDLWTLLEPSRGERFPTLGRSLLKRALRTLGVNAVSVSDLSFIAMKDYEAEEWAEFLSDSNESLVLSSATRRSALSSATCHLEVISRAGLLLCVATEASRRLLAAGSFDRDVLRFWWEKQGLERGMWSASGIPEDPLDSWGDVGEAVTATTDWIGIANATSTLHEARVGLAEHLSALGAFEAAGMWGLVP
jgi:hypothetical protein